MMQPRGPTSIKEAILLDIVLSWCAKHQYSSNLLVPQFFGNSHGWKGGLNFNFFYQKLKSWYSSDAFRNNLKVTVSNLNFVSLNIVKYYLPKRRMLPILPIGWSILNKIFWVQFRIKKFIIPKTEKCKYSVK